MPRDDEDRSLNGKCGKDGKCACRPQWGGDRCETLRLGPAARNSGYRAVDDNHNTSSWGGAVLRDDAGGYRMWASEMTAHCGIGAWAQNSRVIATSPKAGGPYTRAAAVWGVFSHEPMMARADGRVRDVLHVVAHACHSRDVRLLPRRSHVRRLDRAERCPGGAAAAPTRRG